MTSLKDMSVPLIVASLSLDLESPPLTLYTIRVFCASGAYSTAVCNVLPALNVCAVPKEI